MTVAPPLWDHQAQSIEFFGTTPIGFDNSSPGTGKTRVQIETYDRRPKPKGRWLIICPKTLMVSAWLADIEKYAPHLTVSLATAQTREEAFQMTTDVVIINTDGVKFLADKKNQRYLHAFDHLTIDEYTTFKHPTSQRSKAAATASKYFKHRYGMSGTPNPVSVMELWHPALIIDGGKRLGNSYYKLRNAVQQPTQIGPRPEHVRWDDKPGAAQAVEELLADITIRHAFEDVMTHVPPNHRHTIEFDLTPKAAKTYKTLERDAIAQLESGVLTAVHAASLRTKLLQIASGAVYDGNEEGSYTLIDPQRYELITELVGNRDHSVVFFNWRHQRDFLSEGFRKAGIEFALIDGSVKQRDRDQIVDDYQAGKYQSILLHPRTGAHGLTLTRGTTTIFSSPIYEADLMEQAIARIYRGSQDQVTNTIFIKAKKTVEEDVYKKLFDRSFNMNDLLDLMKARHKR